MTPHKPRTISFHGETLQVDDLELLQKMIEKTVNNIGGFKKRLLSDPADRSVLNEIVVNAEFLELLLQEEDAWLKDLEVNTTQEIGNLCRLIEELEAAAAASAER